MKNMKRIAALLLALLLVLAMIPAAFADGETGSITINGVSLKKVEQDEGEQDKYVLEATYTIYKMLALEDYNTSTGQYSYKVVDAWKNFFTGTGAGAAYVEMEGSFVIKWKAAEDADTINAFAKAAIKYAEDNDIDPENTSDNLEEEDANITLTGNILKFDSIPLGYYLVDSTVGALCGLTTTNPNASINAKNTAPTVDKQVQEDSTNQWGGNNTADIGQIVNFRTTINVHAGAQNYVLHDDMGDGLTFKEITKIEHVIPGAGTNTTHKVEETESIENENGGTTEIRNYTIKNAVDSDCTFEIVFTPHFCDHLQTNDKIVVYYTAMMNRNAVIAGEGNLNTAWLSFGETHDSNPDSTTTYTYGIDIVKTDSQNTLLDGAAFRIYDALDDPETEAIEGNEVAVVLMDDNVTYRRARSDEKGVDIVVKDGKVRVVGFDNGTYYLEEVQAPDNYNKIETRQQFIISDGNLYATFNNDIYSTGSGVHVVNKTGSILPETGGIGTTIFYIVGGVLVAAAVVLLVTRKRMSDK